MTKSSTEKTVLAGLFLALGLVLPFITGQIPTIGNKLLPMHIPVLLAGFVCGAPYGLIVGFITPLLRSMLFTMPPMFPIATAMAFELAAYGFFTGVFAGIFPKKNLFIYPNLILSMIIGRIVWGIASLILFGINGTSFTWKFFITGAFINALPGILIQLVLIPIIVVALRKGRLIESEYER